MAPDCQGLKDQRSLRGQMIVNAAPVCWIAIYARRPKLETAGRHGTDSLNSHEEASCLPWLTQRKRAKKTTEVTTS